MVVSWTEAFSSFTPSGTGWQNYDIYTNKSVPKGAIAYIVCSNGNDAADRTMGVRTDGSSIERKLIINEAEGGGSTNVGMYVKVDATTGYIETNCDSTTGVTFYLMGYWNGIDFTELKSSAIAGSGESTGWLTEDTTYDDAVLSIICCNEADADALNMGVRTYGSSLTRYISIHEAESSGATALSMSVKTDSSGRFEYYHNMGYNYFYYIFGYFSSGMSYVELAPTAVAVGTANTWESVSVPDILLDEQITSGSSVDTTSSITAVGQKVTENGALDEIHLYLKKFGTLSGDYYIKVWRSSDKAVLWSQNMGPANNIPASATWINTDSVGLTVNEEVIVGIEFSGSDASNYISVYSSLTSAETGENAVTCSSGTWSDVANKDLLYKFYKTHLRIVDNYCMHYDRNGEFDVGFRETGSSLSRYILEHEAESNGYTGYGCPTRVSTSRLMSVYCGTASAEYVGHLGYYKEAPPSATTYETTKTSDARLKKEYVVTKNSDAQLKGTLSTTKTSDAKLVTTISVTKNSDAQLKKIDISITKNSDARLKKTIEVTKTSDARLLKVSDVTKTSDSRLKKVGEVTKTSDSQLKKLGASITKTSDARLLITRTISIETTDNQTVGSSSYTTQLRSRIGQKKTPTGIVTKLGFKLSKTNSPTGNVYARVRDATTDEIYGERVLVLAENIVDGTVYEVTFNTPIDKIGTSLRFLCEFPANASNYISVAASSTNQKSGENLIFYDGSYYDSTGWDAIYYITYGASPKSDARLKKEQLLTKNSDANLKGTKSITKTSDAELMLGVQTYNITKNSDSQLKGTLSLTKNSDARLLKINEFTKTSDAQLKNTISITKNSDANLKGTLSTTKNSDARLRKTYESTKNSDANLKGTLTLTKNSDARFKATKVVFAIATDHQETIGGVNFQTGFAYRIGQKKTVSGTVSSIGFRIKRSPTITGNVYARIRKVSDDTILAEVSVLASDIPTSYTWIDFTFPTPVAINESVYVLIEHPEAVFGTKMLYVSSTNPSVKPNEFVVAYTTVYDESSYVDYDLAYHLYYLSPIYSDANLKGTLSTTKNSDSRLLKVRETTKTSDARLLKIGEITKTSDSRLLIVQSLTKTSNALLINNISLTKTSDAQLKGTLSLTKNSNANLKGTLLLTKNSDSNLKGTNLITKASDARLLKVQTVTKTSDSTLVLLGEVTKNSNALLVVRACLHGRYDMETLNGSDLKDLSGYGNDGTPSGGVTIGGATGIHGNATDFDGSDDYINLGTNSTLTNISSNNLTLIAWVKPDALSLVTSIIDSTTSSTSPYALRVNSSGQVEVSLKLNSVVYTKTFGSVGAVATGVWTMIAFTFDGTDWKCYINKIPEATQTQAGTLDTTANGIVLGRYSP